MVSPKQQFNNRRGIMTDLPVRRQPRSWLPDWSDFWPDLWTGFPSLAPMRPSHLIRLEDEVQDGHYLLRAAVSSTMGPGVRLDLSTLQSAGAA